MHTAPIQTGELREKDLPNSWGEWSDYARFAVTFSPRDREVCRELASACVVSVGFGPPAPFASAELSATNRRLTQRASVSASRTESESLVPILIVLWRWRRRAGKSSLITSRAPAARTSSTARATRN